MPGTEQKNIIRKIFTVTGVVELSIFVDKSVRKDVIGTRLLLDMIDTARVMKHHKIILQVLESNGHAIGIYEKLGFDKVGTFKDQGYVDNKWVNVTIMEKIISTHQVNTNIKPAIFKL